MDDIIEIHSRHRVLLPIVLKAIQTMDPVNGVTLKQLLRHSKSLIMNQGWTTEEAKESLMSALRYGLLRGQVERHGRDRFGLNLLATDDVEDALCGSCGGQKKRMRKAKRKACPKKRAKRRPVPRGRG